MILEELEDVAGHSLCHICGPIAGISTYYCEGCGALVQIRNSAIRLFQVPVGSPSSETLCTNKVKNPNGRSALREKLLALLVDEVDKMLTGAD